MLACKNNHTLGRYGQTHEDAWKTDKNCSMGSNILKYKTSHFNMNINVKIQALKNVPSCWSNYFMFSH
jgi:hypothetical protein